MNNAVTTQLANYAACIQYSDLPESVRREAVRSFFNIVGCILGGARHQGVEIADSALGGFAGPVWRQFLFDQAADVRALPA